MQIVQGDSYLIPIKIRYLDEYVTPSTVEDVRIQVGYTLKTYSKGELQFDSTTNEWLYPLTQQESLAFGNILEPVQVGIKIDNTIVYSPHRDIVVNDNVIKKEW